MKVMILGDSPLLKTGFGRVNGIAASRFQEEGWEVASVAGLAKEAVKDDKGIKLYMPSKAQDVLGIADIAEAVKDFKPDVAYMTADPGSVTALSYGTPDMPAFAYVPVEGEPLVNRDWRKVLSVLPIATCSKYGADVIQKELGREVPWVYHGVDHETFKPSPLRDEVRKNMHWEDKFVVTCVSTNVRRKQIPRLIEAISKLRFQYKQKDIILYLHTVPFQNYWLEGWNLTEISRMYGISDQVFFHPFMAKFNSHVPEATGNPANPGLVELYSASDLFVLPSQVEGFGLPIAEAMACGVPVLVTKYAAGWEVASPAGRGIPVADWEVHKSGTMYANVGSDALAKEILRLKRNPKELARMRAAGLERVKDFSWDKFREVLIPYMEQAVESFTSSNTSSEGKDKGDFEAPQEKDGDGEDGLTNRSAASAFLAEGQGQDFYDKKPQDSSGEEAPSQETAIVEN